MAKWADYIITKKKMINNHIELVKVYKDNGVNELEFRGDIKRDIVIREIENNISYVTATFDKDGKLVLGAKVHIIEVEGYYYLQTNPNKIKKDNLENLLDF